MTIDDNDELRARIAVRGRGTGELAKGRFERLEVEFEPEGEARTG